MNRHEGADGCQNLYRFIRCRMEADISDREIARRWAMPWRSFTLLKSGRRHLPSLAALERLAVLLAVDPAIVYAVAGGARADKTHALLEAGDDAELAKLLMPIVLAGARDTAPDLFDLRLARVPDAVFALDLDRRLVHFNHTLCQWVQRPAEELQGCTFCELLIPEQRGNMQRHLAQIYRSGEAGDILAHFEVADGSTRSADLRGCRIDDSHGGAHGIQITARDITARFRELQRASLEERRLRNLIESMPVIVIELELDGRIVHANRTFLGEPGQTMMGRDFFENIPRAQQADFRQSLQRVLESRQPQEWLSEVALDGVSRRFRCRAGLVQRGSEPTGLLLACSEVLDQSS